MKAIVQVFLRNENTKATKVFYLLGFLSFFLMCLTILLFSNNSLHLLYYVFFAAFAICTAVRCVLKKQFSLYIRDFIALLFLLCVTVSKILNPSSAFSTTPYSVVAIYIVCNHFIDRNNFNYILYIMHLAFLIFLIVFVIYYRNNILALDFQARIGNFFQNENTVGYYFVYGFSLCLWFSSKKKFALLWLIPAFADVLMILYTGSRSSLLIVIVLTIVFLFSLFRLKYWWLPTIIMISSAIIIIMLLNIPALSSFSSRISKLLSGDDTSLLERMMLLKEGLFMFVSKPLIGWGYNGMRSVSTGHLFAHNNFVQLLADFGIFGFLLFESLLFLPIIKMIGGVKKRALNEPVFLFLSLIIPLFMIQFFYANYQLKFEYIFLSIVGVLTYNRSILYNNNAFRNVSCYECNI